MSREEVSKILKEATDAKPDSMIIVYRAGDQFKIHITGGVEAHYMKDLIGVYLHNVVAGQFKRDVPASMEAEHVN